MSLRTHRVISGSLSTKKADNSLQHSSKGKSSSYLKTFFSLPKSPLDILKGILTGTILTFAIVKSPSFWIGVNKAARLNNFAATPISAQSSSDILRKPIPKEVKDFLWSK